MDNFAIIILAAGASSRLGRPKQLLPYKNDLLINHAISKAHKSDIGPVVVVLGAHATAIKNALLDVPMHVVENSDWQSGISSSIRLGIEQALSIHPLVSGIILSVCDQPFLSKEIFQNLVHRHDATGAQIVASKYADTLGCPALFSPSYFTALGELQGDTGAKKLITTHADRVVSIDFPEGAIDIDSSADYIGLTNKD